MTDFVSFMIAVLVLLLTPGPTNTLIAIAAATNGRRSALLLIPAEVSGYFVSIGMLLLLVREMVAVFPTIGERYALAAPCTSHTSRARFGITAKKMTRAGRFDFGTFL